MTRLDKTRDSGLTEAFGGVNTSTTLFSVCASNAILMMRTVRSREEREGLGPNPMSQKIICFSTFETRLQQIDRGQIVIRDYFLAARPFWQLALVVGNSVDPSDPAGTATSKRRPADPNLVDKFSDFCIGTGASRWPGCGLQGVAPVSSAACREMSCRPDLNILSPVERPIRLTSKDGDDCT